MLNDPQTYTETGEKTARAVNNNDGATAKFFMVWLNRAMALEQGEDKKTARNLYAAAYERVRKQYLGFA